MDSCPPSAVRTELPTPEPVDYRQVAELSYQEPTPTSPAHEKSRKRALFLAGLIPLILLVGWVSKYAVDVPCRDEWLMIPLLAKAHDHTLTFADLWEQHNEHRI